MGGNRPTCNCVRKASVTYPRMSNITTLNLTCTIGRGHRCHTTSFVSLVGGSIGSLSDRCRGNTAGACCVGRAAINTSPRAVRLSGCVNGVNTNLVSTTRLLGNVRGGRLDSRVGLPGVCINVRGAASLGLTTCFTNRARNCSYSITGADITSTAVSNGVLAIGNLTTNDAALSMATTSNADRAIMMAIHGDTNGGN